ncbi:MAG: hypothetical protein ABSA17_07225, partial [Rhabdochlamydiaceae bacterium]
MRVKPRMMGLTTRELNSLQQGEIDHFFELGQKWDLSSMLSKGGSVIFPHTLISTCGDQVAAAVTGCLDSGKKRIIVVGVLHSLNHQHIIDARLRLRREEDVSNEPCRGIFGPMFSGQEPVWQEEYSLEGFRSSSGESCYCNHRFLPPWSCIYASACFSNAADFSRSGKIFHGRH